MTPRDKVEKWFVAPLRVLREKGVGDEGFLVLMVGISLAERITASKVKKDKQVGKKQSPEKCGADLFGISEGDFSGFWNMYRNGLMHYAHPFSGKFLQGDDTFWDWDISSAYGALPEVVETEPKKKVIRIDPWKWLEHVLSKYDAYPDLVDLGDSRKFGSVRSEPGTIPSLLVTPPNPATPIIPVLKTGSFNG